MLLLKLPAFLLGVYMMYWSLPLANIFLCIKAWKLVGPRNDIYQWCHFLVNAFRTKFRKYGSNDLYRGAPCIYLSNHRSWSDFFMDAYLTEGRGQLMSRMAVVYVFPMFMIPVTWVRGCICFKRGSIADKQKFNAWIDNCVKASPVPGICLFPEGHRSRAPHSLPLKRGMLHYAYSRNMPVQIVMSAHKELAMDEKTFHVRFGTTCVTGYSELIPASTYATFEEFCVAIQSVWDKLWVRVFSADPAELPLLDINNPAGFHYPMVLRLSQLFWTVVELFLMVWGLRWSWHSWQAAVARLAGAVGLANALSQVK
eukprot:GHRR01023058.1.p1 GENE.GHRR01023058.1~~GHRR01023058.1.p1  ORF type:complete len:312 (+),score=62.16 GHRR01023058.1:288-1223(+)